MRFSKTLLAAAAFGASLTAAASAQAAPPAAPAAAPARPAPAPARPAGTAPGTAPAARPAITPATNITEPEIANYAKALVKVSEIGRTVTAGAEPTDVQKTAMMAAVTSNGLTIERFQSIGAAAARDKVLKARIILAATAPSPAGSIAAAVTDAETQKFAKVIIAIQAQHPANPPTPEQITAQKAAVVAAGLTVERFQAIMTAANSDQRLHARIALVAARMGV